MWPPDLKSWLNLLLVVMHSQNSEIELWCSSRWACRAASGVMPDVTLRDFALHWLARLPLRMGDRFARGVARACAAEPRIARLLSAPLDRAPKRSRCSRRPGRALLPFVERARATRDHLQPAAHREAARRRVGTAGESFSRARSPRRPRGFPDLAPTARARALSLVLAVRADGLGARDATTALIARATRSGRAAAAPERRMRAASSYASGASSRSSSTRSRATTGGAPTREPAA